MEKRYIGIDLGGTNIAAGIVTGMGELLASKSVPTALPASREELEKRMAVLCLDLCRENGYGITDISALGIGVPGSVDGQEGTVLRVVNLGIDDWHLREAMEKLLGIPVFVENDANAAIIAEAVAGCAKGVRDALIVTLGTGVGGGALVDGKVYAGANYNGLEVGHTVIRMGGRLCNCGRRGCFERYASATALIADTRRAMRRHPESLMNSMCPDISKAGPKLVFDAAKAGDRTAAGVVDRYIRYLATGLVNLINIFQPEVLCLGGGISNQGQHLLDLLRPLIDAEDFARTSKKRCKIKIATFRNDAGIIGAALVGAYND